MVSIEELKKFEVFVINGEALRDLFNKNNHVGYKIMKKIASVISIRLRNLNKKFVDTLLKMNKMDN